MGKAKKYIRSVLPDEVVINKIYLIRGKKVMLDRDLADMYGVETRVLNQAVKRNIERFPKDFIFQLTKKEFDNLFKSLEEQGFYVYGDDIKLGRTKKNAFCFH
jgi:hypothetical protein